MPSQPAKLVIRLEKALADWFIRHFLETRPPRDFGVPEAFLSKVSQGDRREVADHFRRMEAFNRTGAVRALRTAWKADRTLSRAVIADRDMPPERCVDSLALDFTTQLRGKGMNAI